MALLASQQVVQAGLNPTLQAAAAGGDTFRPGTTTWLEVDNAGGGAVTVTIDSVTPSNYGTDEDLAVSVPAGGRRKIGPLSEQRFAGAAGTGSISYSGVTSVTVGVFHI
jgi:hypothetical protein